MFGDIAKILRNTFKCKEVTRESAPDRRWRLWQVEPTLACNLRCVMCPWVDERKKSRNEGHMSRHTWNLLRPHLKEVRSIDFTGGGEPLLQENLFDWIEDARVHGCETGFLTNGVLLNEKVVKKILDVPLNWLGISIDGADRGTYERIRPGSDLGCICENIRKLTESRDDQLPYIMINFVMMRSNIHQLEDIVGLAGELGADQLNFKQCDVIRGEYGDGPGLFGPEESKKIHQLKKALQGARNLAEKKGIKTKAFGFTPDELPVCEQDPRDSLFIRYNGDVSPCINLAMGGPSQFLGKDIVFPNVCYGNLEEESLPELWKSDICDHYRQTFITRVAAYEHSLASADFGHDIIKLKEAFNTAQKSMVQAPDGCLNCHYLYDI